LEHCSEVADLPAQSDTAVGVHGAHPAHVPAGLAEAAKELGAEELDPDAELGDKRVALDEVEHVLVVQPRVLLPRRVPKLVELDRLHVGPHVREAAIGGVAQVVRVAVEAVAGDLEVPVRIEVRHRVPEPHDVRVLKCSEFRTDTHIGNKKFRMTYRENEAVSLLKHLPEEINPPPHHLEVPIAHEVLLSGEVHATGDECEAVPVYLLAARVRRHVQRHDDQVVQERPGALADPEAFQEDVNHRPGLRPRRVQRRQDHGVLRHRRCAQDSLQPRVLTVLHVARWSI
jgi:hypothetical protein